MAGELTRVILKTTLGLTLSHTGEDAADVNYGAKCIHTFLATLNLADLE